MSINNQPYLNTLQGLNLYSPNNVYTLDNNKLSNTISTIVSLATNNSFDFSNTLLGRVLLPNTPIQQVANVELAKAFTARFAQNLRTNVLPSVSINGVFGININRPANYWKIDGKPSQSLTDLLKVMAGYESLENPVPMITKTFTSEDSNNWLKKNRGEGQNDQYNFDVSLNKYTDNKSSSQYGKDNLSASVIKLGSIPESLLFQTNQMLNDNSLIEGEPSDVSKVGDNFNISALVFKHINDNGTLKRIPKGDGTTTDDTGTKFLRTFSKTNRYDSTKDLMKFKHGTAGPNSVLQTVFPNIAPLRDDVVAKNLMFSIENLAYKDNQINIKDSEKVPNGGRIMWFAPYDIRISENVTVGWDKVNFIGRSEPIHTYNGSERACSLSFTLIADYPAELNNIEWGDGSKTNNEYNKFFRQDNNLTKRNLSTIEKDKIAVKQIENLPIDKPKPIAPPVNPFPVSNSLKYYFDNNDYTLKTKLTQDNSTGTGQKSIDIFNSKINDLTMFLNTDEGKNFTVVIDGSASALFTKQYNKILSFFRGKSVYNKIIGDLKDIDNYKLNDYNNTLQQQVIPTKDQSVNEKFKIITHGESDATNQISTPQTIKVDVRDRFAAIYLEYNTKLDTTLKKEPTYTGGDLQEVSVVAPSKVYQTNDQFYYSRYKADEDTELTNFNKDDLSENLLKSYSNNIKYFMPVFHSQTPIDLNERVTFLQQCAKQGNSLTDKSNSIFGRPPVCILRLGDFFHTKIIITNISLDYEPLIWDTNPEGIGMQPMICRVNMNCIIIGGSSLNGPISKLQNALDYNYYANTEVYNQVALSASIKQGQDNTTKNGIKTNTINNSIGSNNV